jgi:hypothetical protein
MGLFDMISSFLNPQEGYKAAQKPVQQGWNQAQGFQIPFVNNGKSQINPLVDAETRLLHPEQLENQWASQYEQSPYAQQLLKKNQAQGLDAASAMGLNGSSAAIGNIQQGAGEITSKDRQQFMQDLMEKFLHGIGIGQNIYGVGAGSAGNLGNQSIRTGETLGNLKGNEVNAPGNLLNNLIQTAVQAFGSYAGGGA